MLAVGARREVLTTEQNTGAPPGLNGRRAVSARRRAGQRSVRVGPSPSNRGCTHSTRTGKPAKRRALAVVANETVTVLAFSVNRAP